MKTTIIPINGLDVKFSDVKPTRPGAYWWLPPGSTNPDVIQLFEIPAVSEFDSGLWSAPLVPTVEVEKAYREGFYDGSAGMNINSTELIAAQSEDYSKSRARRVVEGGME